MAAVGRMPLLLSGWPAAAVFCSVEEPPSPEGADAEGGGFAVLSWPTGSIFPL